MITPIKEKEELTTTELISFKKRQFLPENEKLENFETVKKYIDDLLSRKINTTKDLKKWLHDREELENVLAERMERKYIAFTREATNPQLRKEYEEYFSKVVIPFLESKHHLDLFYLSQSLRKELEGQIPGIDLYHRKLETDVEIFRKENIPLIEKDRKLGNDYSELMGSLTVEWEGKELTLSQAQKHLRQEKDRSKRRKLYILINEKVLAHRENFHNLLDELIALRHQIAQNAGFKNYIEYKWKSLHRFDYTIDDNRDFHKGVNKYLKQKLNQYYGVVQERHGVDALKPYDLVITNPAKGEPRLKGTQDDFIKLTIEVLKLVHPDFAHYISYMAEHGFLDLFARKGKAPGGYNLYLKEIGIPFIFMNASGSFSDVRVIIHEAGHAVHDFLTRNMEFSFQREFPIEIAELASQGMEYLTIKNWRLFLADQEEYSTAVEEQLAGSLRLLSHIATIDAFQLWLYENPNHSWEDREKTWLNTLKQFQPDIVDYSEFEEFRQTRWMQQLHIFEVPLYYIEYGISLLGALQLYKHSLTNYQDAVEGYRKALSLGYTRSLPELYEAAGLTFHFGENKVKDISEFVWDRLSEVINEELPA